jgi:hypothetical protein
MLLAMHMLALCVAGIIFFVMLFLHRRKRLAQTLNHPDGDPAPDTGAIRPPCWLAIRSVSPEAVRAVLADKTAFLISPHTNGWVIVSGSGLPCPGDDVDECFRFLLGLSRELGHVQYFYAEPFAAHHAWARLDDGCVTRAYAWAGETVWNQGPPTLAENTLALKCFAYGDEAGSGSWTTNEAAAANLEKIPLLATRWSLDPATLPRGDGIAGESSRLY